MNTPSLSTKKPSGAEAKITHLESIVEQIGEAVLATTNTIEHFANRVDALAVQVQEQGNQIKQQSYQILALTDTMETLVTSQQDSLDQLVHLTKALQRILGAIDSPDDIET